MNPRWKEEGAVFALTNAQRQENAQNITHFLADNCHFVPASNSELKLVMEEATCEQMNYGLDWMKEEMELLNSGEDGLEHGENMEQK